MTEVGFVSLLVAGFGALAGGLGYLALRVARRRPKEFADGDPTLAERAARR